jgi:L-seryl-tRNA(Ser) seleniumtransferase
MDVRASLPSVHEVLEEDRARRLIAEHGRPLVLAVVQRTLAEERSSGAVRAWEERWSAVEAAIARLRKPRLRPVINATGVILHTNLGRAPMSAEAAAAAAEAAVRYVNLELDLETGRRGGRHGLVSDLLSELTGAEAGAVVNNGAAATLLVLAALARGREVIISRGELVEIGGGFRMPEVMKLSGARMVEVGTTNRTRLEDYRQAIGPKTAAILKVHQSNFRISGFTESADLGSLTTLARAAGIHLLHDLGSGALLDTTTFGLNPEPRIGESLDAGADLVVCSGDKLLGGPQAGLILGAASLVKRTVSHPLARAVRVDKMTLAALAATLDGYLRQRLPPVWSMLAASTEQLDGRARAWADKLRGAGCHTELRQGASTVGGGSAPGEELPSALLAIVAPFSAQHLLERLRRADPPVIGRVLDGSVVLDPRTVLESEDEALFEAVVAALR